MKTAKEQIAADEQQLADDERAGTGTADDTAALEIDKASETKSAPSEPGKFEGDVKDGYRWDAKAGEWIEHVGVDHTKTSPEQLAAFGMTRSGDGSPDKPHNVQPVGRW
jgi:hypothetical protein